MQKVKISFKFALTGVSYAKDGKIVSQCLTYVHYVQVWIQRCRKLKSSKEKLNHREELKGNKLA